MQMIPSAEAIGQGESKRPESLAGAHWGHPWPSSSRDTLQRVGLAIGGLEEETRELLRELDDVLALAACDFEDDALCREDIRHRSGHTDRHVRAANSIIDLPNIADVLFTFDLLKQKGRPQQRDALGQVKRAEALDPMTVRFDLSGSDGEMPLRLATMPVLSKQATDVDRFDSPTLKPPVGTGPYVITDVQPGRRLILRRNPNYWARDLPVQRGLFNFDEIEIDYYRDANSSFEAFSAGLCDFRQETDAGRWLSSYDFPAVRDGRIVKESLPYGLPKGMEGFAFNTRRSIFADVRVREALGMMFDFEWINANFYGGLYRRSRSFFDDSELASAGRPADAGERALLAAFPGAVRDDILEGR